MSAYNFPTAGPVPLGLIKPTSGTPLSIVSNIAAAVDAGSRFVGFHFRPGKDGALATNTGNVYIGAVGMDKTTLAGVYWVIKPADGIIAVEIVHDRMIFGGDQIVVDVASTGDGVHVVGFTM